MPTDTAIRFEQAFSRFDATKPILVVTHNDADGLSAGAIFQRAFAALRRASEVRVLGRGESAWDDAIQAEWRDRDLGGMIVADLGTRGGPLGTDATTILIDHHVPTGVPDGVTVLSGFDEDPIPTSSLLALRCAAPLTGNDDLLWLAAVGLIGDLGDKAPFEALATARARFGVTALKDLVALVNAPRRASAGDAGPALQLLLQAESPKDALKGSHPERALLQAAREEVKAALEIGKRQPPRVVGDVALIALDTACQIHPLVAQAWRMRLKDKIVIAANTGYRPGWVHFATRSATGRNLIEFLRTVRPEGADDHYGNGHEQATGGALRTQDWPEFLDRLGFSPAPWGLRARSPPA
ncbi:phosphoesterase [Lichenihabitans sp. Uapishka_5]|uniref:phosphoesterase n=1 Tax=Lichenihabitans sp. Uapishka_5 TaxID=3037302 RepID=UPI0029E80A2A|nr:phosphoesterase [Lichenihabitans sp. Uapishka_5]MDX7949899.1 phosphoesterase [Lichenihabitans sp. Uapishka_5]